MCESSDAAIVRLENDLEMLPHQSDSTQRTPRNAFSTSPIPSPKSSNSQLQTNHVAGVERTGDRRNKASTVKRRRGATAVEMALIAPLFFLFTLALIEFGRIALVKQVLTDAARAGCREAVLATTLSQEEVEAVIRDNLRAILADTQVDSCNLTVSHANLSNIQQGTEITTSVEVNCSDVSWIAPRYGDVMIRAESTMERE